MGQDPRLLWMVRPQVYGARPLLTAPPRSVRSRHVFARNRTLVSRRGRGCERRASQVPRFAPVVAVGFRAVLDSLASAGSWLSHTRWLVPLGTVVAAFAAVFTAIIAAFIGWQARNVANAQKGIAGLAEITTMNDRLYTTEFLTPRHRVLPSTTWSALPSIPRVHMTFSTLWRTWHSMNGTTTSTWTTLQRSFHPSSFVGGTSRNPSSGRSVKSAAIP